MDGVVDCCFAWTSGTLGKGCLCLASLGPTWKPWEDSSGGALNQSRQQPRAHFP